MKKSACSLFFGVLLCFSFSGLQAQIFHEVGATLGITHTYGIGQDGGGISFHDFDGDGWDDITLTSQIGSPIYFFKNNNGVFTQIPAPVANFHETKQILWADYDNDGDKDLFITALGAPNLLYENTGGFTFAEVTASRGLPVINEDTYGACWGDINNDGWLDLYINNYDNFSQTNHLYLNSGSGTFIDITTLSGTSDGNKFTLCSAFLDVNNDGYQDIYISNDKTDKNTLLLNNGNSTFSDISASSGSDLMIDAMSVAVGDFDNNDYLDIYVTNNPPSNKLLKNNGNLTFSEVAATYGVIHNAACWGANFLDYDNDSDLDLYVCTSQKGGVQLQNKLYRNDSSIFTIHSGGFIGDTLESYSNAIGDYNNDGAPDIAVLNAFASNSALWATKNVTNNWIKIELEGTISNRDGIGTWIEVYSGKLKVKRYTHCGIGYLGQNSGATIIGLDTNTVIDSLVVRWLSGHVDKAYNLTVNQKIKVIEGSAIDDRPVLIYNSNAVCSGDSVLLKVEGTYSKYAWSTGDSSKIVFVKPPGSYFVTVTNQFGFTKTSDTIHLDAFPNNLSAGCEAFDSYEGLNNGMAIVTATDGTPPYGYSWNDPAKQKNDTAFNLAPGTYQAVVKDAQGCFRKCEATVDEITGTASELQSRESIRIYPSPAVSVLHVESDEVWIANAQITLFDRQGRQVAQEKCCTLDIRHLPSGIYLIRITSEQAIRQQRVVISR